MSLVSWRGDVLAVSEAFTRIRQQTVHRPPILIMDYSHGGAIGFPSLMDFAADIVVGDLIKWLAPPRTDYQLAFLWFASAVQFRIAKRAFYGFRFATKRNVQPPPSSELLSRWVSTADMVTMNEFFGSTHLDRESLLMRHAANKQMAESLAARLGIQRPLQSSVIWLPESQDVDSTLIQELDSLGLVWHFPGRGTRIICRSESNEGSQQQPKDLPATAGF